MLKTIRRTWKSIRHRLHDEYSTSRSRLGRFQNESLAEFQEYDEVHETNEDTNKEALLLRSKAEATDETDNFITTTVECHEDGNIEETERKSTCSLKRLSVDRLSHVDQNDIQSVFSAIYNKVQGTPLETTLLKILQSLLKNDLQTIQSENMLMLLEKMTQEELRNKTDEEDIPLLEEELVKETADVATQKEFTDANETTPADVATQKEFTDANETTPAVSPLSLTLDSPKPLDPPSPLPLPHTTGTETSHIPQPPPPPGAQSFGLFAPIPIDTPTPIKKMRSLTWNKIPSIAFKKESIWNQVLNMNDSIEIDYKKVEEMFSQKQVAALKIAKKSEVILLAPKRSMNVNIFLKQLRKPNDVIIQQIKEADSKGLGVEKVKGLMEHLPQQEEIEMIQGYEGEIERLGQAEQFYYHLTKLPDFKLRIEMMLLKADFNSQIGTIRPNIQVLTSVCRSFLDSESLKMFLRFVLRVGNFLNKGKGIGGAIGFYLGSLDKLLMTKSNTANMTLVHYLVEEAQHKNKDSLKFVQNLLEPLQKAPRFSLDGIIVEFKRLESHVISLKGSLGDSDEEVKTQFSKFILAAEGDITETGKAIEEVKELCSDIAVYYCEDEKSFKVDEFIDSFKDFCEKVKTCEHELETWRVNAEKAEQRRKSKADISRGKKGGQGKVKRRFFNKKKDDAK